MTRRWTSGVVALALVATACSGGDDAEVAVPVPGADGAESPIVGADIDDTETASTPSAATSTTAPPATVAPETTTTSTTSTTTTTTTSTTTTTTEPPLDVYDPACVVRVEEGDSLGLIADRFDDETVDAETIIAENDLNGPEIRPNWLLDVCVDNGLDDIDGEQRSEPNAALAARAVMRQQEKLNELFAGYGIRELLVDGVSGPVTRQRVCAARLALGLDVNTTDLEPGSEEEALIMEATELPTPFTTAVLEERWVLIDRTCQIMFVGSLGETVYVFPTSTGEAGYETRDQDRSRAFRFNPASANGGWHNSTTFPVAEDNPLNGNMYKPIYFDGGQAIHGANNVPRSPQSKGCARLRVEHQNLLVDWLGLSGPTTNRGTIGLAVNVQGEFVYR
ncbi:MAG: L,D-transpeptidase family protein [Actinomycetota bacterium]